MATNGDTKLCLVTSIAIALAALGALGLVILSVYLLWQFPPVLWRVLLHWDPLTFRTFPEMVVGVPCLIMAYLVATAAGLWLAQWPVRQWVALCVRWHAWYCGIPPLRWKVFLTDLYTDEEYVVEEEGAPEEKVRNKRRPWYGQRIDKIEPRREDAR